jgi:hypothetical protein
MTMICFTCPHCQAALRASGHFLGRNIRCPKCQQVINIPAPVHTPAPPPAPNWLDDVEKVEGKQFPIAAASSPPVLEPAEMPERKAMQQAQPPVASIVTDSHTQAAKGGQQSSGNGIGKKGLHLYLLRKRRAVFLGTAALIIGLWALWPVAGLLATATLIIVKEWKTQKARKAALANRASFMAFIGAAALMIGLLLFLSGWDRTGVDELFELSLPRDTIDVLYPEKQQNRLVAMALGTTFVLAGLVLLLLSRRFRPSSVLGTTSLAFGVVAVLHYWNLKTVFWTGIGGIPYHDHAREHEQLVGVIAGVGWIIASLLFLLLVRMSALHQHQRLQKTRDG